MKIRRTLRIIEKSGLKDLLGRYTLDSYETPEEWQQKVKETAVEYLNNPSGRWFAALGAVGSGKTHICTAICGELIKRGNEVRYMRWKDDSQAIKAVTNESEEYDRLVHPLQAVRVLYIDDLWKTKRGELPTTADVDLAFKILNARYNNRELITLISSEWTVHELIDIDEAVGSRVFERSKGFCTNLAGKDKNWRLR
jgi:DNA replication protein DnaC